MYIRALAARSVRPILEALEERLQFSGAADLAHSTASLSQARWSPGGASAGGTAFFGGGIYVDAAGNPTNSSVFHGCRRARAISQSRRNAP